MEECFLTINNSPTSEIVRKRSVFKGSMIHVTNKDEVEDFFNLIKSENKAAKHNVLAYALYNPRMSYCNDDGEPSKTAGEPILNIINKHCIFDVCVVVTRYFGGVLLGTGGLVEAYSSACKALFENADYAKCCLCARLKLVVNYSDYAKLSFLLNFFNVSALNVDFAERVTLVFFIKLSSFEDFKTALIERIGTNFFLEILEKKWSCLDITQDEVEKIRTKGK